MKITQIMLSKGWGGAERIFIDLVKGLAERDIQVQAIMDKRFKQKSQLEHVADVYPFHIRPLFHWDFLAANRLHRAIKEFSPDIVHCHLSRAALMGGSAAGRLSLPAVTTTHNNMKLKYCRKIDRFLVLTENQRSYLTSQGIENSAITKIPNFSNVEPVAEVEKKLDPVFVAYGRMVPKKGFDDLIHAFSLLKKRNPRIKLLLGGDGAQKDKLHRLTLELGVEQQVHFVGWIDNVREFLSQGTVFVLPSRDEPFGIVLLEAMANGLPIVTTKTGGACEILGDETAYFSEIADPVSLSKAMERALSAPECWSKAEAALMLFNARYRKNSVIPRIISYYHELLLDLGVA